MIMAIMADICIGLTCVILLLGHADGYTYVSEDTTQTPEELCTLALPDLIFSTNGISAEVNVSSIDGLTIQEGISLWIGYAQILQPFLYKGCSNVKDVTPSQQGSIRTDPGQCYSYCQRRTDYIGISGNECLCIDSLSTDNNILKKKDCSTDCVNQNDLLCGGEDHVSVYQPGAVPDSSNENKVEKRCLKADRGIRKWSDCGEDRQYMCEDDDGTLKIGWWWGFADTWKNIMQKCAKSDRLPVQIYPWHSDILNDSRNMWSGHIRSYHIVDYAEAAGNVVIRHGYVTKNNMGTFNVGFTEKGPSYKALCSRDTTTTTNTVSSTPHSSRPTKSPSTTSTDSLHSSTSAHVTSLSTLVSTETTEDVTTENDGSSSDGLTGSENKSTIGNNSQMVAVYVAVPLSLLLAAIVIAIYIWWRRRRATSDKEETSAYYTGTDKGPKVTDTAMVNPSYQDDHIIESKPTKLKDETQNDYFVLVPVDEYADIDDVDLDKADDNDYDTTNTLNVSKDTGNIYSRMNDVSDDTYNHTNWTDRNEEEDTYDHTGINDGSSMYNTTDTLPYNGVHASDNEHKQTEQSCGTYNHLNSRSKSDGIADERIAYNDIGITMRDPRQVADAYSYATPAAREPVQLPGKSDQTYNYAYAAPTDSDGTAQRPAMFTFDRLPNADDYEMAKDIPTNGYYELAKQPGI